MKKAKSFATEAAMCAHFLEAVPKEWTPYPETAGWDILLVRRADGFQIGIQAKLRFSTDVVNQTLEEYDTWSADRAGPDCRAVLVPDNQHGWSRIAAYIGFTIIAVYPKRDPKIYGHSSVFSPSLPGLKDPSFYQRDWPEWAPPKRHMLPEYVPDVAAGASAPIQLTTWKIAAIKIAVTLELRGFVTRADFKAHDIDHRRWLPAEGGWLARDARGFVVGPKFPNFRAAHPRVYEEIKADASKWMPAAPRDLLSGAA